MRNYVIKPANQFIARFGQQAYSKAREAERAARNQGKAQLATSHREVRAGHVEGARGKRSDLIGFLW